MYTRRYIFYSGLDMESALELGVAAGGWFACVNATEEREILDSHLENSFFTTDRSEPRHEESTSRHESFSIHGLNFHLSHPQILLLSPLPNHEHRRKKKFNLRSSLSDSRMTIQETSETPRVILGTKSLQNRCIFLRPSVDFSALHPQWIG